jgi:hypothetical protein
MWIRGERDRDVSLQALDANWLDLVLRARNNVRDTLLHCKARNRNAVLEKDGGYAMVQTT